MKFYDSKHAPSPRRARIFMAEKGIEGIEFIQLDLSKGEQFSDWFKEINPLSTVPVLEVDEGLYISDSSAIELYFEEMQQEPNLLGRDMYEKAQIQMWDSRISQYLYAPIGGAFRHGHDFFKGIHEQIPQWAPYSKSKAETFMDFLNEHLATHDFIASDRFTAVDINAYVAIDFGKVSDIRTGDREHLQKWYEVINSRASTQA
jgi:glutathione S-transferase